MGAITVSHSPGAQCSLNAALNIFHNTSCAMLFIPKRKAFKYGPFIFFVDFVCLCLNFNLILNIFFKIPMEKMNAKTVSATGTADNVSSRCCALSWTILMAIIKLFFFAHLSPSRWKLYIWSLKNSHMIWGMNRACGTAGVGRVAH